MCCEPEEVSASNDFLLLLSSSLFFLFFLPEHKSMIQGLCKGLIIGKIQSFAMNELIIWWGRYIISIQSGSGGDMQTGQLSMLSLNCLETVIVVLEGLIFEKYLKLFLHDSLQQKISCFIIMYSFFSFHIICLKKLIMPFLTLSLYTSLLSFCTFLFIGIYLFIYWNDYLMNVWAPLIH